VIIEPRSSLRRGERVKVKRDRRMDDVVVVDLCQRLEVVERCGPIREISRSGLYERGPEQRASNTNHDEGENRRQA
jgi:hypothetical protein